MPNKLRSHGAERPSTASCGSAAHPASRRPEWIQTTRTTEYSEHTENGTTVNCGVIDAPDGFNHQMNKINADEEQRSGLHFHSIHLRSTPVICGWIF
ncbi:hypothetical protein HQ447_11515 [bacterium]|nr:hypothetical protein [bacterium]